MAIEEQVGIPYLQLEPDRSASFNHNNYRDDRETHMEPSTEAPWDPLDRNVV